MPLFSFSGLVATVYPETRDAANRPVGTVQPGDVREFAQAPDWLWVPAGGSDEQPGVPEDAAGVSGTGVPAAAPETPALVPVPPPAPVPAGPVAAPPAVIPAGPQPFAVTTPQEG